MQHQLHRRIRYRAGSQPRLDDIRECREVRESGASARGICALLLVSPWLAVRLSDAWR
jgi:hypothetical protein